MHDLIEKAAYELGFRAVYFLPVTVPPDYALAAASQSIKTHLCLDVRSQWSDASCVILLVFPYTPFARSERIPAYYIASNRAYHAVKSLAAFIEAHGFFTSTDSVPARAYALYNGIGTQGRNALLRIEPFGSRLVLSTIITNAVPPRGFVSRKSARCPNRCTACIDACPSKAIDENGYTAKKCMRFFMDPAEHSDFILEHMETFVGCEICQQVCPLNAALGTTEPTPEQKAAFDIDSLLSGRTKDARLLLGKNFTSNGKLTAEAATFAARDRYPRETIEKLLISDFEAVRNTAKRILAKDLTKA